MLPSFLSPTGGRSLFIEGAERVLARTVQHCKRDLPQTGQQGQCWGSEFDAGMVNLLRALSQVIYSLDAELFTSCLLGTADCHCLVSEGETQVMLKGTVLQRDAKLEVLNNLMTCSSI